MGARFRRLPETPSPRLGWSERFGVRSLAQLSTDVATVLRDGLAGRRFQLDWRSLGILRPLLSLPAQVGWLPKDGLAPIFNLFDRTGGGRRYTNRVSRTNCRDFRGGTLTYDEHDGTDLVCPPGTPLVAAAPGIAVMIRDNWLRGGLTVAVDHGHGIVTQYTHCARTLVALGQPVVRDQPVALSGTSGIDMTQFFPWVAPHVHFMVYVDGRPVDPFRAEGEARRAGHFMHGNQPRPLRPLPDDPARPTPSPVDLEALMRAADACSDAAIRDQIAAVRDRPSALAALLEDALCHEAWAFPEACRHAGVRPRRQRLPPVDAVRISLPLPHGLYRGVSLADTPWSSAPR